MNMKRILSAALVLAMLVGLVPGAGVTAKADDEPTTTKTITQDTENHQATMTVSVNVPAKEPVAYLDWNDTQKKLVSATSGMDYLYVTSDMTAWGQQAEVGDPAITTWYVVDKNVTIDTVTVTGDVRLILCDGATLNACRIDEGLGTNALTIYGQSAGTGKLIVTNANDPAIGAMSILLTVNGGAVEATSENGPAIFGSFTVNGGTVTAIGNPATYNATVGDGMTILAGDSAADAQPVDSYSSQKRWVYIEKGTPLTNVTYLDEKGASQTLEAGLIDNPGYTRVRPYTPTWSNGWYVVDKNVTIDERVAVTGTVHLILCDGAELKATKGITTTGATLNIYAQSTGDNMGKLTATGGSGAAGIGGYFDNNSFTSYGGGTVTINGGTVNATGGSNGAGIGGGGNADGGTVTINGGTVNATGGNGAAGIGGGGAGGNGGTVTINGGTVTATGGDSGAGIGGGGYEADGGTVTINGGTVNATGGN
ncbi:MAG: hypothetical protein IKN81_06440, partial [Oscillospiraceae bacterium]|nr:hypothetical protein [Oscillospiraceae bacterium]